MDTKMPESNVMNEVEMVQFDLDVQKIVNIIIVETEFFKDQICNDKWKNVIYEKEMVNQVLIVHLIVNYDDHNLSQKKAF